MLQGSAFVKTDDWEDCRCCCSPTNKRLTQNYLKYLLTGSKAFEKQNTVLKVDIRSEKAFGTIITIYLQAVNVASVHKMVNVALRTCEILEKKK